MTTIDDDDDDDNDDDDDIASGQTHFFVSVSYTSMPGTEEHGAMVRNDVSV